MITQIKNSFPNLKGDFTRDTGLSITAATMPVYIAYFHARVADVQAQVITLLFEQGLPTKK